MLETEDLAERPHWEVQQVLRCQEVKGLLVYRLAQQPTTLVDRAGLRLSAEAAAAGTPPWPATRARPIQAAAAGAAQRMPSMCHLAAAADQAALFKLSLHLRLQLTAILLVAAVLLEQEEVVATTALLEDQALFV